MPSPATTGLLLDTAHDAGFSPDGLRRAFALLDGWIEQGVLPGAAALVARGGRVAGEAYLGVAERASGRKVDPETIWGLASITKPVTATAVLLLVERGLVALDQPLCTLIPEFLGGPETGFDRCAVTLRHQLSHCSGLPGFSPDNFDLRRMHRPLADFVRSFYRQPLLFAPGALHYYSNVGICLAAEVVGRALGGVLGQRVESPAVDRYHAFVQEAILGRLGMASSSLRPPAEWDGRIARVEDTGQEGTDWEMANSAYYRSLGIPWGGLFSRPRDLIRFVDLFLPAAGGRQRIGVADSTIPAPPIIAPATARVMTTVQFAPPDAPPDLAPELREGGPPDVIRPQVEWGLGWAVKGTKRGHESGDLTSPATYSHSGATGTVTWADPATDIACVLPTNRAQRSGWHTDELRMARFANAVMAAAL
jgi:beta-lactamase class C